MDEAVLEVVVQYEGSTAKERTHLKVNLANITMKALKGRVVEVLGVKEEAARRGLGHSIDVVLARVAKSDSQVKNFTFSTDEGLQLEVPGFLKGSNLLGN